MPIQCLGPRRIRLFSLGMLAAIDFDHELAGGDRKIRHVRTDRMLATHLAGQIDGP